MLTVGKIETDYNEFKSIANELILKKKFDDAEKFIVAASRIAYNFNFIYADKELDSMLKQISCFYIDEVDFDKIDGRYVFFDSFGQDNRGLTQQYIRALMQWGVEFLYILEYENSQCENIINELRQYSGATVFVMPKTKTGKEKAQLIYDLVASFQADKAFLHLSPWSSTAIIAWNALTTVTRYSIDLTDHAFWLGSDFCDYYIGFRGYSAFVSSHLRGIGKEKLMIMPYYPISDDVDSFQGFEFDFSNKKIVFTGGSYYKMYGKDNIFLNILKKICEDNHNVVIAIAGSGNSKIIEDFIATNGLNERIFLIGNRKDISEVFKHIDIYLNTYPIGGGLMTQFAVLNNKPVIAYGQSNVILSIAESLFSYPCDIEMTYFNLSEFHSEINHMLSDDVYCSSKTKFYDELLLSPEDFSKELNCKIMDNVTVDTIIDIPDFNKSELIDIYLNAENKYLKSYERNKISNLRLTYARYNVIKFSRDVFFMLKGMIQDNLMRMLTR
jgi:hypothetical protein